MALLRQLQLLLHLPRTHAPPSEPGAVASPVNNEAAAPVSHPTHQAGAARDASRRPRRQARPADPAGSPRIDAILHTWSEGVLSRAEASAAPGTPTFRSLRAETDGRGHGGAALLPLDC